VLKGQEPENNARKINKPIAVILLAHMVEQLHKAGWRLADPLQKALE